MSIQSLRPDTLFELKLLFLRELANGYRSARLAQEALLRRPQDDKNLEELMLFFHRIAGFASRVDLSVLGHLASVCERSIDTARRTEGFDRVALAHLVSEGMQGVAAVLDEHGSGPTERPLPRQSSSLEGISIPEGVGEGRELSKVLVIDDDEFTAGLIDSTLRAAGFMSSYCCDPQRAIEKIEEELPDLIILDVMMPEVDGFELCRRVRTHPAMAFTPILFVTRKGDVEQRVRGLEVGANDYIAKPFEPRELVARVRSHLQRLATLREMAIRDGLTRCYNHKYFKMRLEQEMARARRYSHPLAIALVDIDHFKRVNDQHGHVVGDLVLSHMSNVVSASVRSTDVVARYGGEEFAILMVHAGAPEAEIICNRLRERVARHNFGLPNEGEGEKAAEKIALTVSIGVAEFRNEDASARGLVERADQALYSAKENGRNALRIHAVG